MSNKSILIFGGGENQITLIKAAKSCGYISIVIDPFENAIGKNYSDYFEIVKPDDFEGTCKIVEKYDIKGIVTSQMENPLRLMAKIAEKYNFIFPTVEQIEICRNKYLMKKLLQKNNISVARGLLFSSDDEITTYNLKEFEFPLIIKPVDSYSSRGVLKVNTFEELKRCEHATRNFSSNKSIIVEEFIEGKEYSIESLTFNSETTVIQYTSKIITDYPNTVETGHIQPAELTGNEKKEIDKVVKSAIEVIGLKNTATHVELKINNGKVVFIEIGARLGGDYISSYLTLLSTGINMDKGAVSIAMGKEPVFEKKDERYSMIKYFSLPPGKKIKNISEDINMINNYTEKFHLSIKTGDILQKITDSSKRAGFFIITGNSYDELYNKSSVIENQIFNYIETE